MNPCGFSPHSTADLLQKTSLELVKQDIGHSYWIRYNQCLFFELANTIRKLLAQTVDKTPIE
jgi:hypothetical protein